ncbi:hypothetical protein [Sphingobacterium bovistauri]|uniref:Uncharacterized protein n=1 Tax=Sphingobacterium bovistauri TaxID=2781959 RepID=A0ABS7ZAU9_9SPHI|nr:hypothetical protein [Sphingobacterium bovistauri]MCA5005995.1 hypothetical protein [Sphingobacterium bovistauri]
MAEHNLVFNQSSAEVLDIEVGDYLTYKGELMTINQQPEVTRSHKLDYTIVFEGVRHSLTR